MKRDLKACPEFYRAIQSDELVYLFGAGSSLALTDNRAVSWRQWIMNGIACMKDRSLAENYRKALESDGSTDHLIRIAGGVISALKKEGSYWDWMTESFHSLTVTNDRMAATLRKLLITQDIFATTNYDLLLEEAAGLSTLTYEEPHLAFPMLDRKKNGAVLHLHGVFDAAAGRDNIIADQQQYDKVLNDEGAQFIQHVLGTRTLVFVGCGQTAEDANISRFVRFAKEKLRMDKDYFFLCRSGQEPEDLPPHMKPVVFGSEYEDLPLFLEDVAQERLRVWSERSPLVGRTVYTGEAVLTGELTDYHYSQERVPFCGREKEIGSLLRFVADDAGFSWWAITGQAGSGKSRLAYEFMRHLPAAWYGFFVNDKASIKDAEAYLPFTDTLAVIDYVSGREAYAAELIERLRYRFADTPYSLRILLIERENNRGAGSWYARLSQRFSRYDSLERYRYAENFLNIEDMDDGSVAAFIGFVCRLNGLSPDPDRDIALREAYRSKLEYLRFRPLFVQIFVEAWIQNGCSLPRYDGFEDLLRMLLYREQEKWLSALGGDQQCCNALIHLLLRANISGELKMQKLPDYYKPDWQIVQRYIENHSYPGQQRQEKMASVISSLCQNTDGRQTRMIPLFPDIIKEYMFFFYMEEERLEAVMSEIWQNEANDFTIFIVRCLTDFPGNEFYRKALNAYNQTTRDDKVLANRLRLLRARMIKKDDDPNVLYGIVENEHAFWKAVALPAEEDADYEKLSLIKISGLNLVAQALGRWSLYDVSAMVDAVEEALAVPSGEAGEIMKRVFLGEHITELSKAGFLKEASYLQTKMDVLLAGTAHSGLRSMLNMQNKNSVMMAKLLDEDFEAAYQVLKKMDAECDYACQDAVRLLAHSCFNYDYFSCNCHKTNCIGRGAGLIEKAELLYPDDWNIRARAIGCRAAGLQMDFFSRSIRKEEAEDKLKALEEALGSMEFGHEDSDEALNLSWGILKTFKLNFIADDEGQVKDLIAETKSILKQNPALDEVASVLLTATHALYKRILKEKVPRRVVEELFSYVEKNYDSAVLRNLFFEILEDSEEAGRRENYMTEKVLLGARQDARYNPLIGSGIPEIDGAAEMLHWLSDCRPDEPYRRERRKIGANEPCPCGSGKKFKKCCRGNGKYD